MPLRRAAPQIAHCLTDTARMFFQGHVGRQEYEAHALPLYRHYAAAVRLQAAKSL